MDYKLAILNYKSNDPLTVSTFVDFTMQISTKLFLKIGRIDYSKVSLSKFLQFLFSRSENHLT